MTPQELNLTLCSYCGKDCLFAYGKCHCGCGRDATLSTRGNIRLGILKNKPLRFILGHQKLVPRAIVVQPDDPRIRHIALTQGYIAVVSSESYVNLSAKNWCASKHEINGRTAVYAICCIKQKRIVMQNYLLPPPEGYMVDHIDGNTLNNTLRNLRFATKRENNLNSAIQCNNTSGYPGVYWNGKKHKWIAKIHINRKDIYLGSFHDRESAIAARITAEKKYYGEFAPHRRVSIRALPVSDGGVAPAAD